MQLSVIHQGAGEAGQVEVRGQVNPLGEPHLRRGRGAERGVGGGGGAGLSFLSTCLLHGHHRQAPALQLDGDVAGGVAAGIQGHQEVAGVLFGLLDLFVLLCAGSLSLLLFAITQPERKAGCESQSSPSLHGARVYVPPVRISFGIIGLS